MNTDNKIKRLHKKRHALMRDGLDTLESISVLEEITEIYVLENRDECALNCYKEYIYQLERIVGPETLSRDYRSKLIFLKELQVVAANFNDKITLCRDFVYDVFEYCGINSRAGLHAIELFFVCCYDTGETEEITKEDLYVGAWVEIDCESYHNSGYHPIFTIKVIEPTKPTK